MTGRWLSEAQARAGQRRRRARRQRTRVIPYVEDRRNILVLQLAAPVDAGTALSVMYALERGIEAAFQLEDSELDGELLPPDDGPRDRLLFTEAAEGGAGVLRRLHAEPDALARVARGALRIAHFDPDTGTDLGGVDPAPLCARGCYDCLLTYGNQLDHPLIDRHGAPVLLMAWLGDDAARRTRPVTD